MVGWNNVMPYNYSLHVANFSWLSNWGQTLAHFQNHVERFFLLALDRRMSLLPNNNNWQSQSRQIATKNNADDGADLDTKDHLAFVVDGHKTKGKEESFRIYWNLLMHNLMWSLSLRRTAWTKIGGGFICHFGRGLWFNNKVLEGN